MDLDWTDQIRRMSHMITSWGTKILASGVSSIKSFEIYKTVLLARLDGGLCFAEIPEKTRNKWSRRILKYVFQCDDVDHHLLTSISESAFSEVTNTSLINEILWK